MSSGVESQPGSECVRQPNPDGVERDHESSEGVDVYEAAFRRHGKAFLAYILLGDIDRESTNPAGDFERLYIGYFPDRVAFTQEQLAYNNWDGNVGGFIARLGLPESVVRWDYEELWEHLAEVYRLSERFGGVHAFRR